MITDTFKEYKSNFGKLIKVLLLLYLLPICVFFFLIFGGIVGITAIMGQGDFSPVNIVKYGLAGIFLFAVLCLVMVLLNALMQIAIIRLIALRKANADISLKELLSGSSKYIARLFGLYSMYFIYLGVPTVIVVTIMGVLLAFLESAFKSPLLILIIILAVLAIIAVLTAIMIRYIIYWVFSPYFLVIENKGVFESMAESKKLVKGRWWMIFGYLFLCGLIVGGFSFAAYLILLFPMLMLMLIPVFGSIVSQLLQYCVSMLTIPFSIIFTVLLYERCKDAGETKK